MMQADLERSAGTEGGEIIETDYIRVTFQKGFPSQVGINGCRVENVLEVAQARLEEYQQGPLACQENEDALNSIRTAIQALQHRTKRRQEQGVLNTNSPHEYERTEDQDEDFSATGA